VEVVEKKKGTVKAAGRKEAFLPLFPF
jgi:hypothetical protein